MPDPEEQPAAEGHGPAAEGTEPPPPTPEEAAAEQEQAEGKSTGEGQPAPPMDTAAGGAGRESKPESPPTAGEASATAADAQPAAAAEAKPAAAAAARPARPAREAEPKEAPRNPPAPGSINEFLAAAVPGVQMKAYTVPAFVGESVAVEVNRDDVPAVMTAARDDPRLDLKYLRCLSGVDWQEEGLEVAYQLLSINKKHELTVKTRVSIEDATIPSIAHIFPAADWHERETRDMFGIHFEGHPNLVPLLLPEDMTDHFPLRKDNPLQEIEEWQGELLREGAGEGDEGEE